MVAAGTIRGKIGVAYYLSDFPVSLKAPRFTYEQHPPENLPDVSNLGFERHLYLAGFAWLSGRPFDGRTVLVLPCWFLAPALLLPFAGWLKFNVGRQQRERRRRGLCPVCGYDLRATPEQCPECGAVGGT